MTPKSQEGYIPPRHVRLHDPQHLQWQRAQLNEHPSVILPQPQQLNHSFHPLSHSLDTESEKNNVIGNHISPMQQQKASDHLQGDTSGLIPLPWLSNDTTKGSNNKGRSRGSSLLHNPHDEGQFALLRGRCLPWPLLHAPQPGVIPAFAPWIPNKGLQASELDLFPLLLLQTKGKESITHPNSLTGLYLKGQMKCRSSEQRSFSFGSNKEKINLII